MALHWRWSGRLAERLCAKIQAIDNETYPRLTRFVCRHARIASLLALFESAVLCVYLDHLALAGINKAPRTQQAGEEEEKRRAQRDVGAEASAHKLEPTADYLEHLTGSPKLKRNFRLYIIAINALYCSWIVQTLVIIALDAPSLAPYRFLDCLLLGRFTLNGRASAGTKYVCLLLLTFLASMRLFLTSGRFTPQNFRFDCLDFMLHSAPFVMRQTSCRRLTRHVMTRTWRTRHASERLETYEIHYKKRHLGLLEAPDALVNVGGNGRRATIFRHLAPLPEIAPTTTIASEHNGGEWDVFFARARFAAHEFHVLKLNRSPRFWFWYNCSSTYCLFSYLLFCLTWTAFFAYVIAPTSLTKRGYEFGYPHCLAHLAKVVRNNRTLARQYDFIYEPTPVCAAAAASAEESSKLGQANNNRLALFQQQHDNATDSSCKLHYGLDERASWPVLLPFENFTTGWYHATRSLLDFLLSLTILTDIILFFSANVIFINWAAFDLILNSILISRRLDCLRQRLWQDRDAAARVPAAPAQMSRPQPPPPPPPPPPIGARRSVGQNNKLARAKLEPWLKFHEVTLGAGIASLIVSGNRRRRRFSFVRQHPTGGGRPLANDDDGARLERGAPELTVDFDEVKNERLLESIQLQTLLVDHFNTNYYYNRFVSFYCLNVGALWLAYTLIVLLWRGLRSDKSELEFEFYAAILGVATLVLMLLTLLAVIRNFNKRLYPLIASVMALDVQHPNKMRSIKQRWLVIMSHFEPKPMYCFTFISAEISNLLVLKLIAWIFSAFFVIVGFLNMRIDFNRRFVAPRGL